ncbi:mandelonitrile lyase [Cystoisospora suis]|uniref:Mandelonitrile lyase n=1 Tax=Cystoisospora suis TaxID=483139 RepID=A0A2C6LCB4_9APIC|nr:mandelonitrile lyase [Cystoisospora suis]
MDQTGHRGFFSRGYRRLWLLAALITTLITSVTAQPWAGVTHDFPLFFDPFNKKRLPSNKYSQDGPKYDYIIVGAGAAGCPLAGYLANQGRKVLLLERGPLRNDEDTPNAMDMYGAGLGIADPSISQTIATRNGVRTHVGAVMGGGTSVSLGIYIEEPWSFFEYLNRKYNAGWEEAIFRKAHAEAQRFFGTNEEDHITPNDTPFGPPFGDALKKQGYEPLGGSLPAQPSKGIRLGYHWNGYSQFSNRDKFRKTADFFISRGYVKKEFRHNLTIRTGHFVEKVEWERDADSPIATCVVYRLTKAKDIAAQGTKVQIPAASSNSRLESWLTTVVEAAASAAGTNDVLAQYGAKFVPATTHRRACLRDNDRSRIILSAGAIHTAALLYRSGVGPLPQLRTINIRPVLEIPSLGQEFIDRAFITINLFKQHFADAIEPIPISFVRRLEASDETRLRSSMKENGTRRRNNRKEAREQGRGGRAAARPDEEGCCETTETATESTQERKGGWVTALGRPDSMASDSFTRKDLGRAQNGRTATLPEEQSTAEVSGETRKSTGGNGAAEHTNERETGRPGVSRSDPLRVTDDALNFFLPPISTPLAPHVTGTLKDHLFPWLGELEPTRLCQSTGIRLLGPTCPRNPSDYSPPPKTEPFLLQSSTLSCSAVPLGQVSGARVAEGVIYATRCILPPLMRSDPVADAMFETLQACSEHRPPFGLPLLKPLCAIAYPVIKCFRQVYGTFYYTAQPKSRGSVRLKEDGELEVNSNHLTHEEDLFDAVRGVSTLLKMTKDNSYMKTVQPTNIASCPATVLNGLLDILTTIGSTSSIFLTRPTNFFLIQNHLQDLLPPQYRRLRRIVKVDEAVEPRRLASTYTDEETLLNGQRQGDLYEFEDYSSHVLEGLDLETMERIGIKKHLEEVGFDFKSYVEHVNSRSRHEVRSAPSNPDEAFKTHPASAAGSRTRPRKNHIGPLQAQQSLPSDSRRHKALREAEDDCRAACSLSGDGRDLGYCPASDICCTVLGNSRCISTPTELKEKISLLRENESAASARQQTGGDSFLATEQQPWPGVQWVASYPPVLPNPHVPKDVAKYALTYMSSIWHHANTVPMGKLVDQNFDLKGALRLSVIDSSVLNELPRMNPTATLMMLGIYGGMTKERQRASS